ncbi:stage II sporulation protein M [Psychroflexus salis]|uniref:Membrane protein n=1 Tax=Psychroflexus salis TaxID=1526574 RepID=A0A917EBY2_9FLAO|nr:stage II sporulation protein M [Psychroflexus salis]GGE19740.1 membrane protein [Psychroflexus salis]
MREAAFIKQNKNKWIKFESVLQNNAKLSPDQLSNLYLNVTEDLSYSQTFYPNSETTSYLNELASISHQKIYKSKKESRNRFYRFYFQEFPLAFKKHHPQLLLAFSIFLVFSIIGAYSASVDDSFVRLILGDGYVNMTLANIENGDPMAVYKKANQADMFMGITVNNIRVSLTAFAYGLFFGLGSIFIAMQNGIMLGSFQYFFYDQGLLWESARTIWIHGTIEISVIIIATCAGIVVGKGMLFPGTYSRLQSFINGVKSGLKIVISTVPFFIVAGFLEGFVTRYTQMPDALAICIILASLFLIIYYYVLHPIQLNKKQHATNI